MSKVVLQFNSIDDLWKFRLLMENKQFQINTDHCTLTCTCTDEEIEMAFRSFDVRLLT